MKLHCTSISSHVNLRATIVWLHGIGQEPEELAQFVFELQLTQDGIHSLVPHARGSHSSPFTNQTVRAWCQQSLSELSKLTDSEQLWQSVSLLKDILEDVSERTHPLPVYLAGFSQGAAIAVLLEMMYPHLIDRLLLFAPYLLSKAIPFDSAEFSAHKCPVWIGHGGDDLVVPLRKVLQVFARLAKRGHQITWQTYPVAHESFKGADQDLRAYIINAATLKQSLHTPSSQLGQIS